MFRTELSPRGNHRNRRLVIACKPGKASGSPDHRAMSGPYLRSARSRKMRISARISGGAVPVPATARMNRGLRSMLRQGIETLALTSGENDRQGVLENGAGPRGGSFQGSITPRALAISFLSHGFFVIGLFVRTIRDFESS